MQLLAKTENAKKNAKKMQVAFPLPWGQPGLKPLVSKKKHFRVQKITPPNNELTKYIKGWGWNGQNGVKLLIDYNTMVKSKC